MMKMKKLARHILSFRLGREQGAIALAMVLAFMVLAVPISLAAVRLADELAVSSRVYDSRMTGHYSASSGIEYAIWQVVSDPTFDDDLTPDNPSKETVVESSGESVTITVTKIFSDADLQGQAVVIAKTVDPATAPVDTLTTFTYTISITNEGSDTVRLKEITDYLPPHFSYVAGSTGGDLTSMDPTIDYGAGGEQCGDCPDQLQWDFAPKIDIGAEETKVLTFQATATLSDGTYYNQVRVRYDPWWSSHHFYVYTPHTAEVSVGEGSSKCGYDMKLLVNKEADPPKAPPGVETEVAYTITIENLTSQTLYICKVEDVLPPDYTYVEGSSADYLDNIACFDPFISQEPHRERWVLTWANAGTPLTSLAPGETKTQVFRAVVTAEPGVNYYNEISAVWSDQDNCKKGGETAYGGTGGSSLVTAPPVYDITSVAEDGSVLSRILFWEDDGEVVILSWQQQ